MEVVADGEMPLATGDEDMTSVTELRSAVKAAVEAENTAGMDLAIAIGDLWAYHVDADGKEWSSAGDETEAKADVWTTYQKAGGRIGNERVVYAIARAAYRLGDEATRFTCAASLQAISGAVQSEDGLAYVLKHTENGNVTTTAAKKLAGKVASKFGKGTKSNNGPKDPTAGNVAKVVELALALEDGNAMAIDPNALEAAAARLIQVAATAREAQSAAIQAGV